MNETTSILVVDDDPAVHHGGAMSQRTASPAVAGNPGDRHGYGATLITSQFPVPQWHEVIGDPTVADAILDRLVHNAYRLEFGGKSLRDSKTPSDKQQ